MKNVRSPAPGGKKKGGGTDNTVSSLSNPMGSLGFTSLGAHAFG